VGNVLGFVVAAIYLFAILPVVTSFAGLVLVLAPVLLVGGAFQSVPAWAARATPFNLGFLIMLSLGQRYSADFVTFANVALAQAIGFLAAALTFALFRSVRADWLALRILRTGWR